MVKRAAGKSPTAGAIAIEKQLSKMAKRIWTMEARQTEADDHLSIIATALISLTQEIARFRETVQGLQNEVRAIVNILGSNSDGQPFTGSGALRSRVADLLTHPYPDPEEEVLAVGEGAPVGSEERTPGRSKGRPVKVATFNINNVNKRLDNLLSWLADAEPDVVCLQELKAEQGAFPAATLGELGYSGVWRGEILVCCEDTGTADKHQALSDCFSEHASA